MATCRPMLEGFSGHHCATCLKVSLRLLVKLQRYLSGNYACLPCKNGNDRAEQSRAEPIENQQNRRWTYQILRSMLPNPSNQRSQWERQKIITTLWYRNAARKLWADIPKYEGTGLFTLASRQYKSSARLEILWLFWKEHSRGLRERGCQLGMSLMILQRCLPSTIELILWSKAV